MGHYWSEMRDDPSPLEIKQAKASKLVSQLCKHKSSKFTVEELKLLMRTGWSEYKDHYYDKECDAVIKIAERLGEKC